MGEGIVDSQLTQQHYWLILEQMKSGMQNTDQVPPIGNRDYEMPSHYVNQLSNILNYPVNMYFVERQDESQINLNGMVSLFKMHFPCDVHLTNLRTQTERELPLFPSQRVLMVVHRQASSCKIHGIGHFCSNERGFDAHGLNLFNNITLDSVHQTSLTGIQQYNQITQFNSVFVEPMDMMSFNLTFV